MTVEATITREAIIDKLKADTAMWQGLDIRQRIDLITVWCKGLGNRQADGLSRIITAWERHCAEAGHSPASQGGTATYSSTHDKTAAICCACEWFISAG